MSQKPIELILARQLGSTLAVPVLLTDAEGSILYFNEPAERLLGRRFDEVGELPFENRGSLLQPRDASGRPMPADELPGMVAIRERTPVHCRFWIRGMDGVDRLLEATAFPLEGPGRQRLGAVVMFWQVEDGEGSRA